MEVKTFSIRMEAHKYQRLKELTEEYLTSMNSVVSLLLDYSRYDMDAALAYRKELSQQKRKERSKYRSLLKEGETIASNTNPKEGGYNEGN